MGNEEKGNPEKAPKERARPNHFRNKPRPGRRVPISYQVMEADGDEGEASRGEPVRVFTRNIGVGGAFIVTEDPPPPGTELWLTVHVPPLDNELELRGQVRWIADGEDDAVHGMGIKFSGLEVDQLLVLNEYFASLGGGE